MNVLRTASLRAVRVARWVVAMTLTIAGASHAGDDRAWSDLAAAAQREGKVVVMGPAHPEVRRALPAAFKARFGVDMEYMGGPASAAAIKLRAERSAGLYTADVTLAGVQSMATIFHREGLLDPIRPLLLPEVLDGSKWKRGEPWFMDPEGQYVLRLFSTQSEQFSINTRAVKPADMRTARDLLLNPKFKSKMATHDPTVPGTGSNQMARFYVQFGDDFAKQLYVDQKPMISRDERQLTDWLLRGTYSIVFGVDDAEIDEMSKEGQPVQAIFTLPDLPGIVAVGNGLVGLFKNAPHPNAARLFVNWIASKDGLETYARAVKWSPTRNDIDEAQFVPPQSIPTPGAEYFDLSDWNFTVTTKESARLRMKELLGR